MQPEESRDPWEPSGAFVQASRYRVNRLAQDTP